MMKKMNAPLGKKHFKAVAGKSKKQNEGADISKGRLPKPYFFHSIRIELIGSYFILIVLIILLGSITYLKASQAIMAHYTKATESTVTKTADYYNLILSIVKSDSLEYSLDSSLVNYYSGQYSNSSKLEQLGYYEQIKYNLDSAAIANKFISSITVLGAHGTPISTDESLNNLDYKAFQGTEEAAAVDSSGGFIWSGNYPSFYGNKPGAKKEKGLLIYRQIQSKTRKQIGYMVIEVKYEELYHVLADLDLGKGSTYALVTPDGSEIISQTDLEGKNAAASGGEGAMLYGKEFYKQAMAGKEDHGASYVEYHGEQYLFLYSKLGEGGFLMCSLIPKSHILEQANEIKFITILLVVVATVIAIAIGTMISTGISNTIRQITSGLSKAAGGDLTVKIHTRRKDEFKWLAESITHMINNMQGVIEKAVEVSRTVLNSSESVNSHSGILLEKTRVINGCIEQMEQGLVQQAEDSESCMLKMEQLAMKINQVSESSGDIAQIAEGTKRTITQGILTIGELDEKMKDTTGITNTIIAGMEDLETAAKSINKIVDMINEIAAQTNLLSLNASIEAARAGNAGKGFAIVAKEIHQLAEQSAEAVNSIRKIIGNIDIKTKETVETAKQAGNIVSSQEVSLLKTIEAFYTIEEQVEILVDNLDKISEGLENIKETKEDTLAAIESISSISQETAAIAGEVNENTNEQFSAVKEMNKEALGLHSNSKELEEAICSFTI